MQFSLLPGEYLEAFLVALLAAILGRCLPGVALGKAATGGGAAQRMRLVYSSSTYDKVSSIRSCTSDGNSLSGDSTSLNRPHYPQPIDHKRHIYFVFCVPTTTCISETVGNKD